MNDTTTQIVGGGGALAALVWFLRWAVTLWATVRREDIVATAATAAAYAAQGERMISALQAQATSNAVLAGRIEASNAMLIGELNKLAIKLETLVDWRDRTPVEGMPITRDDAFTSERPASERDARRRLRTVPQGHRTPKPDRDE